MPRGVKRDGGWLEVISGGMFAGKTEELISRVRRAGYARQRVQVFKPVLDTRYEEEGIRVISSHTGWRVEAVAVGSARDILKLVEDGTTVVAIDEAQFIDSDIVSVCDTLADWKIRVIVAGLNLDFRGEPFGSMPQLLDRADEVTTLHAICVVCGQPASRTQRLINGQPAKYDDPIILVGGEKEGYEARCRDCHIVPRG